MKTRKIILGVILILAVLVFIGSCATIIKEPNETLKTLLIGQIELTAAGCRRPGSTVTVDGTHRGGIEIHLVDPQTGETFKLKSKGPSGFFHFSNPTAKMYEVTRLDYERREDGWASIWKSLSKRNKIRIEVGKVNNLGFLEWVSDRNTRTYRFRKNQKYEVVRTWFKEKYPESAWNNKEWVKLWFEQ